MSRSKLKKTQSKLKKSKKRIKKLEAKLAKREKEFVPLTDTPIETPQSIHEPQPESEQYKVRHLSLNHRKDKAPQPIEWYTEKAGCP